MKLITLLAITTFLYSNLFAGPPSEGNWVPLPEFTDEFDGNQLDATKWHNTNPTWMGREPGLFSTNNVSVSDGQLHITAKAEDVPNAPKGYHSFTTAAVKSKTTIKYGYFEIKSKAMNSRASSAFWFYNHEENWWTEIDVFEITGGHPEKDNFYHQTLHVFITPKDGKNHWMRSEVWEAPFRFADDYHVFGLEWNREEIIWTVDGKVTRRAENTHWHQPLYMNFDSETFPGWFGLPEKENLPSTFHVEYVRAWQKKPEEKKATPPIKDCGTPDGK